VERLLEGLDERDRLMLILKEVEGFSIEEIGEVFRAECEHGEGQALPRATADRTAGKQARGLSGKEAACGTC